MLSSIFERFSMQNNSGSTPYNGTNNASTGSSTNPSTFRPAGAQATDQLKDGVDKLADKAEHAKNEVKDAAKDAKNEAADKVDELKGKASDAAEDVKDKVADTAQDLKEKGARVADQIQESGEKAVNAASSYAKGAVRAVESKVRDVQDQFQSAKSSTSDFIHEDPVRAVTIAAVGSAVLTAALIGLFQRR
jgi:ElaB/YqjD/DUF883 family membrane-anchored ribosome-binding protein